jgi:hypothetical protein
MRRFVVLHIGVVPCNLLLLPHAESLSSDLIRGCFAERSLEARDNRGAVKLMPDTDQPKVELSDGYEASDDELTAIDAALEQAARGETVPESEAAALFARALGHMPGP